MTGRIALFLGVAICAALAVGAQTNVTVLYTFDGDPQPATGRNPWAAMIEGSDGKLYGTTRYGGAGGFGTAFTFTRSGVLTTIKSFDVANQGPNSELVRTGDGILYGATDGRKLFRLLTDGTLTPLHTFPAPQSGLQPYRVSLAVAGNGEIYGVTSHGEPGSDCGTVFTLSASGVVSKIGAFDVLTLGVCHPVDQLLRGVDGNLYGRADTSTTATVTSPLIYYRLTPDGAVTVVPPSEATIRPFAEHERQTRDGTIFGSPSSGGTFNAGYIYRRFPALKPSVPSVQFGATSAGSSFLQQTPDQTVRLTQLGEGTITWSAAVDQPWLRVSPAGGSGSGTITVGVQHVPGLPMPTTVTGSVVLTATGAFANVTIPVTLTVAVIGNNSAPAGLIDTPLDNVTVSGSIAVTGWAVDDLGVTAVRIFRDPVGAEPSGTLVFVGNAVRVEGARPDVAAAFPNLPGASLAGWGYLLLTNMLPAEGNGTFRLHAFAEDVESNSTLLGTRTIIAANSAATTPFGAIDTPGQGDIVSGGNYANFGWVLSPGSRRADPTGGGSVTVLIDGVPVGSPGGWTSRSDLSALFPQAQYEGVTNALGVFSIDTTSLANGVHTIAWAVTDSLGASAGIGSRYFTVVNGAAPLTVPAESPSLFGVLSAAPDETAVRGRVGVDAREVRPCPRVDGTTIVHSGELQRLELQLGPESEIDRLGRRYTGYLRVGDDLRPLPFGARLDPVTGVFTWQPGVGFAGSYHLTFVQWLGAYSVARQDVRVVFEPQSR